MGGRLVRQVALTKPDEPRFLLRDFNTPVTRQPSTSGLKLPQTRGRGKGREVRTAQKHRFEKAR